MLNRRTVLVVLALAALCAGALGSQALAGKKKKTTVVVNSGPVLNGQQKVKVSGSLNTTTACLAARSMRLFLTDQSGAIQATIDSGTSLSGGTWKLSAKLASPPTPDQYLQVKAKKLTVGKFVCKAALSKVIEIK
jgi:hypothetical protein